MLKWCNEITNIDLKRFCNKGLVCTSQKHQNKYFYYGRQVEEEKNWPGDTIVAVQLVSIQSVTNYQIRIIGYRISQVYALLLCLVVLKDRSNKVFYCLDMDQVRIEETLKGINIKLTRRGQIYLYFYNFFNELNFCDT